MSGLLSLEPRDRMTAMKETKRASLRLCRRYMDKDVGEIIEGEDVYPLAPDASSQQTASNARAVKPNKD
jgi:hypothetical protein